MKTRALSLIAGTTTTALALVLSCAMPKKEASSSKATTTSATQAAPAKEPTRTVVLVHGAFAEAASWERVTPLLEARGLRAVAVHLPLTSLGADVDAVTRTIDAQTTPVILVGHSWGGTVITQAGVRDNVTSLVYLAAFAPSEGQSTSDLTKDQPPAPWASGAKASGGFLSLSRETVGAYFAQDLPPSLTDVMAATQGPIAVKSFDEPVTQAAWRTKPSTFVITTEDRMIAPSLQRAMAAKIGARTVEIATSHVGMLSKPEEVALAIASAAPAASR
jgi:pimeloyl-ACP methyl ester carboxylesterase